MNIVELVQAADVAGERERRLETQQLITINNGIDHDDEKESLKLEAIACIHHIPERKRAKRRRYMLCIKRDHLYDHSFISLHSLAPFFPPLSPVACLAGAFIAPLVSPIRMPFDGIDSFDIWKKQRRKCMKECGNEVNMWACILYFLTPHLMSSSLNRLVYV
jgi:hypothetical protein